MSFVVFSAGGYLNGHTAFCIQCPFTFEYSPAEKKKNNQKQSLESRHYAAFTPR